MAFRGALVREPSLRSTFDRPFELGEGLASRIDQGCWQPWSLRIWSWSVWESSSQTGVVVACSDVKSSKKLLKGGKSGNSFTLASEPPWSVNCAPPGTVMVAVYARTFWSPVAADRWAGKSASAPVQIPGREGAFGAKVLVPCTFPTGDVMVKLAVQLVRVPFGGVPGMF